MYMAFLSVENTHKKHTDTQLTGSNCFRIMDSTCSMVYTGIEYYRLQYRYDGIFLYDIDMDNIKKS